MMSITPTATMSDYLYTAHTNPEWPRLLHLLPMNFEHDLPGGSLIA